MGSRPLQLDLCPLLWASAESSKNGLAFYTANTKLLFSCSFVNTAPLAATASGTVSTGRTSLTARHCRSRFPVRNSSAMLSLRLNTDSDQIEQSIILNLARILLKELVNVQFAAYYSKTLPPTMRESGCPGIPAWMTCLKAAP